MERSSVIIIETENKNFYNDLTSFGYEDGFYVAAAFSGYNDVAEYELPRSIGELKFYVAEWGALEGGGFYDEKFYLDTHVCSDEELGLEGDKSNASFFPLDKDSFSVVDYYRAKFLCIPKEFSKINGNFSS